ncbi:EKC/KEOPS complex subunit Cgi121p [Trichomonascus vanleenenianus]|uniref:Cgi121p n=1 Tax=Trichomonascus vanleenenianus TaxID=2268995 RepID=UPI003ECB6F31
MLEKRLPQFPDLAIQISLFDKIENVQQIREGLLSGDQDYAYAFVNASTIVSFEHLMAAVYRAVNDWQSGNLRTRSIHSEIVFCLSPNNNIMEALKRFGISESSRALYAIKVVEKGDSTDYHRFLMATIRGQEVEVNEENIQALTNHAEVKKNYKSTALDTASITAAITLRGY